MSLTNRFLVLLATLLISTNLWAQQPSPSPGASTVKTVEVSAPVKEAEVGQQVKISVVAKDASGNVVNEQPSTYFAGPFDAAAADESGNIKLVGPGKVIAGAIVGGKPGFTIIIVKPPTIKTIEINSLKTPLIAGSTIQLEAITRIPSGDPRTGVPISWTSSDPRVATVDAAGVITGVSPGPATITATSGVASGTTKISVVKSTLRSLTVTADATTARTGDVVHLNAKGSPADPFTPRWSVSGSGATVDPDGGFVAEQPGTYCDGVDRKRFR